MTLKHQEEYRDPQISRHLADAIRQTSRTDIRLMEVCGTHTVSIFRSGIRSILPPTISLLSGPGCPVCVTAQGEIDAFIELARTPGVTVATFGDLIRVPGSESSLQREQAAGSDVRVVYSTVDALEIARKHPDRQVVFLGVGFETTAPTVAASILSASREKLDNYLVYSAHKTVPPALDALMASGAVNIDGFLLPGHVSVIIGLDAYRPFYTAHQVPCAVAGFEPVDLLRAINLLVGQIESGRPGLDNAYGRAVKQAGNPRARQLMDQIFEPADAAWRGIGNIPGSGLRIRDAFADHDARRRLAIDPAPAPEPTGCACGEVLTGAKTPPECPLYRTVCTPTDPVGPCMVSSEGTCAAYYRYHRDS
jgi:hydrogenase expression/formation protein HypD